MNRLLLGLLFLSGSALSLSATQTPAPQNNSQGLDDLAHRLLEKFSDADENGVVVMDSQPAFGQAAAFGPWLADQFSAAIARQGQAVKVIERARLAAALESEHLASVEESDVSKAAQLAESIGAATVVLGSYGAADNGIGVSLTAFRVSAFRSVTVGKISIGDVFGKLSLTPEVVEHLGAPLDSLRPTDGIYRAGYGGVSVPLCVKCSAPSMHAPDVDVQGMLRAHPQGATIWLKFVVTPEGSTRDISVLRPVGFGFDEQYTKAAADWQFTPAVDVDGKSVPATYVYHLSFNFKGSSPSSPSSPTSSAPAGAPLNNTAPAAPETPIQGLIHSADQAVRSRDYATCAQLLEKVVALDPDYKNAWNYLGWTYTMLGQYEKAETALRKAIVVDPRDPRAFNNLGQALALQKKYDDAIPQYQKQIEINPKDQWAHANLGRVYILTKQYEKAIAELQLAATISPDNASIPFNLGRAYVKINNPELATKAFQKSVQLQPVPFRWNSVAYEMAVDKLDLAQAENYAQSAIAATVLEMRDTSLEHLARDDAGKSSRIASYWDTWGWIQFLKGNFAEAEKYVRCAWLIHPLSVDGDHLGQIYEKQGRQADALQMYQMALAADSKADETRQRLSALAGPQADLSALAEQGRLLLKDASSITVKNAHQAEGFAEFWILLSPGPAVRGVKFISGDEQLAAFAKDLENVSFPNIFPEATELRILRRGRLACTRSSEDCRLQMISAPNVSTEELAAARRAPLPARRCNHRNYEGAFSGSAIFGLLGGFFHS
jgi:tetratricopeptide (TPR) repeat protein